MPVWYLLSQWIFSDRRFPCCNFGHQESCYWFSSRIDWHSRLLYIELVGIADYFFGLIQFLLDLPGSFFFLVEIICCVPDFLTILLHSFPFKIMSLVSLLTDFDYFWLCLLSIFVYHGLSCSPFNLLYVCALFATSLFRFILRLC